MIKLTHVLFISLVFMIVSDSRLLAEPIKSELSIIKDLDKPQEPAAERIIRPNKEYGAWDLRDPFKAIGEEEGEKAARQKAEAEAIVAKPPSLKVRGLVWGSSIPQAIVNDKVVKVGDVVEGARIVKIDNKGITVLFQNNEFVLPAPGGKKEQPANH